MFIKPWRFIAAIFIGFAIGFFSGVWVYANYLDKPETVNHNQNHIKQKQKLKVKGNDNRTLPFLKGLFNQESGKEESENEKDNNDGR